MNAEMLDSLDSVIDRYAVFLIDAWGVLHDGKNLYPGAAELLEQLAAAGKKTVILSNAARRIARFREELAELGLTKDMYSCAMTSGELSWRSLKDEQDSAAAGFGRHYFYQGPQRSRSLLDGLALEEVSELTQAELIINTGAEGNQPDASAFTEILKQAQEADLPMICANPDRLAIRGGVPGISAGQIAYDYERLGGRVKYFGKPHLPVYEYCFKLYPGIDRTSFIMLGDGLATDIKGANSAGIDSVLVCSGIHKNELDEGNTLEALYHEYRGRPDFVVQALA